MSYRKPSEGFPLRSFSDLENCIGMLISVNQLGGYDPETGQRVVNMNKPRLYGILEYDKTGYHFKAENDDYIVWILEDLFTLQAPRQEE